MFEKICEDNYKRIYTYILGMTGSREAAEDLTQDVFFIAYQKRREVVAHDKPTAFLYTTAKNLTLAYYRKIKREIPTQTEELSSHEQLASTQDVFDEICENRDRQIDETEYTDKILRMLSAREKMLYEYYYKKHLSMGDISTELGISETAVRMKYVRLRKKVKKMVKQLHLDIHEL